MNGVLQLQTGSHDHAHASSFSPETISEPKPLLVLIAENDENHRSELKELLDLYGVAVLEAVNGEEAINLIVGECPNLVLMNAVLPGLDGYEAARLVRSIKSFDPMPIIFLSGETDRLSRKKAFDVGADGFHIAPLDFDRLDHILENFLFRERLQN